MLKTALQLIGVSVLVLLLVKCHNSEFPQSPYGKIEGLPALVSDNGVTLQANITQIGKLPIINHGFAWGIFHENFPSIRFDTIKLGSTSDLGTFEVTIDTGLYINTEYFVSAFIKTADYIAVGETFSFVSKGSTPPVVENLVPSEGTPGDTITIEGNHFSSLLKNNSVKIGNVDAVIVGNTDSTLRCVVPTLLGGQSFDVVVTVWEKNSVGVKFQVLAPEVVSMTPTEGIFGDTIVVTGNHFSVAKEFLTLKINESTIDVLNLSRTEFSFILPADLDDAQSQVSVTMSRILFPLGEFNVRGPQIDHISNTVISSYENPLLTISGQNFNPIPSKNKVSIGGYECNVTSSSLMQLIVERPHEILPDEDITVQDTFDIEVTVLDQPAQVEQKVVVNYLSRWTRMKDFPGNSRVSGASFAINGKAYIGLGSEQWFNNSYADFWEYDPVIDEWTRLADFPGQARSHFVTMVSDAKVYIVTGSIGEYDKNLSEVWEFDPGTHGWTQKNNFPGEVRYSAFGFTIGTYGYLGGGSNNNTYLNDFWRYDIGNDKWDRLNDVTMSGSGISNGSEGFVLSSEALWKYQESSDSWIYLNANPIPWQSGMPLGFAINNSLYTGIGGIWEARDFYAYSLGSNAWTNILFKGRWHTNGSYFTIANHGYILLGYSSGCSCANLKEVWRFDPTKP
jgi:hypothetical protein